MTARTDDWHRSLAVCTVRGGFDTRKNQNKENHPHGFTAVCGYVKSFLRSSNSVIGLEKKKITTQKHWCTSERFINLLRVYKARWFTHWEACGCSGLMQAPGDGAGSGCISASVSHQPCFNWPFEATCLASTLIIAANNRENSRACWGKRQQLLACSASCVSIQFDKGKKWEYLHRSTSILYHLLMKYSWKKSKKTQAQKKKEIRFFLILSFLGNIGMFYPCGLIAPFSKRQISGSIMTFFFFTFFFYFFLLYILDMKRFGISFTFLHAKFFELWIKNIFQKIEENQKGHGSIFILTMLDVLR